ncbi:MAG: cell division topological specificity factor MinE [Anaerolineae bacterium]|nr:cell division topological specificity factor MinE [Anaerolineales bacterium]MCQ3979469.1 cell division topological specificity factor MinE [Anaerolineae bacterium]
MHLLNRLLGRGEPSSRDIAKDRLRLVLVQDRVNLSSEKMNELKDELIKVISKYVEIDRDGMEISLTQNARQSRLTANIPVVGARQK